MIPASRLPKHRADAGFGVEVRGIARFQRELFVPELQAQPPGEDVHPLLPSCWYTTSSPRSTGTTIRNSCMLKVQLLLERFA